MQDVDGKKFPTVWSDLFLNFDSVKDMDTESTISVKCVTDWIEEFNNMKETNSGDAVDDLYKRGCILNDYLPSVKWRIHNMNAKHNLEYSTWKSRTTTGYVAEIGQKEPSEAARERRVILEKDYQSYKNELISLETMEGWCDDMVKALRENLQELNIRMKKILAEQPRLP